MTKRQYQKQEYEAELAMSSEREPANVDKDVERALADANALENFAASIRKGGEKLATTATEAAYIEGIAARIRTLADRLEALKPISVEERLPEVGSAVFAYEHGEWFASFYVSRGFRDNEGLCEFVTHWMYQPTPPDLLSHQEFAAGLKRYDNDGNELPAPPTAKD